MVGDAAFNPLAGHKRNKHQREACANIERPLLVECHDSNRKNCLDFGGSNEGMLFVVTGCFWCPLKTLLMFYCI